MRFCSILSLLVWPVLMGCTESITTQPTDEADTAFDVAGKQHYVFTGVSYRNFLYANNPAVNPAWYGDYTGPDGTVYTVLFMTTGNGKHHDGGQMGVSHSFAETIYFFTDVVLNDEKAVVSGEPVLVLDVVGIVAPNSPILRRFQLSGSVVDGTGVFEAWIGRQARQKGWVHRDPETLKPTYVENRFYLH